MEKKSSSALPALGPGIEVEIPFSSLNLMENLMNAIILKYSSDFFCLLWEVTHGFQIQSMSERDLSLIITCHSECPVLLVEHFVVTFKNINILFFFCSEES